MKTKIHQNPTVVKWSSRVLNAIGLVLVIAAVFAVSNSKLSQLRQDNRDLPAGYMSAAESIKQLDCLTRNIYWEAASEPFEGKVGVAQVTLNRVESGKFAPTVCGVVYQKNVFYEKVVCQFSWFCETTHKIRPIHKPLWLESEAVAKRYCWKDSDCPAWKTHCSITQTT
jgi:hypothetical protein